MWLAFLALNIIGLTTYNLILRKSLLEKIDSFTLATIMQTGIAIPMFFVLPFYFPDLSVYTPKLLIVVMAIVLLIVTLHISNVKSLQYLEASVYSVLYNLRLVLSTILGILFLAEDIIPLQIVGGLLIFLAIFIMKQKGKKELTIKGILWGIGAALSVSALSVFEKTLINEVGYLDYAFPTMLGTAIIMWIILLSRKHKVNFQIYKSKKILSLMGFRALSAYSFTLAFYTGAKISVANYLSGLSVILIVVLGIIILKERDYLGRKIFATLIAVLGLTAILIANLNLFQ
ncbi:hypothetical protein A3F29_00010 [Candidatus Roizmanbacteria bacterium RIFCSPHIGHO2_12_FULL_33_9]|uniref:EamA domain-containing protein n=1 Tax=Candidatus Roizmanbacteria bacterium RIFCSPHIGHO2_12_FULL_33_9 TaxID=1802045 RepID=A0A1F7HK70_9BACT|nr:MAG: hypothetical protein A3F29_00010 [Candidatus Roizmanbacteria bacterium RIFCSPHIGHO2_12_FULL_33_9]